MSFNQIVNSNSNNNELIDSKYYIKTWLYNSPWMKIPVSMILKDANYIDYYRNNEKVAKENLKFSNHNSFVISNIDSSNKYSKDYLNCTWIIAIWESEETWENISFLTHQNTIWYMEKIKWLDTLFKQKLEESLLELKSKSKNGTIDIVIMWWNDINDFADYTKTIKFLDNIISESTWISAEVVWWPSIVKNLKTKNNTKDIVLNTSDRKIFLFKEYSKIEDNINFYANKINKVLKEVTI